LEKEKEGMKFGRRNLYHLYPLATRNGLSVFPNYNLDILDLKANVCATTLNNNFKQLLQSSTVGEREILNYINRTPAFHIIGAILQGCQFRFGHHSAYLFPEFQLGTTYKADYLLIGKSSGGHEFVFIELESPKDKGNEKVTIQDGELGGIFRKGITQVENWRRWLQENFVSLSEYFEKHKSKEETLSKEFLKYDDTRMHYVVIAGMRDDFSEKTYRIAREYRDTNKTQLLHYENLYDFSCQILKEHTY
jgi:hypothetical protein